MATYTVTDCDGEVELSAVSLADAAEAILTHDGAEYEVRKDAKFGGFSVWSRKPNAEHTEWAETTAYSAAESEAEATQELFELVIYAGWTRQTVMTDEDYSE